MNYTPQVKLKEPDQIFQVGTHTAHLHSEVISTGMIYYRFLLAVYDGQGLPCLYVTSETNLESVIFGTKAPHFLCIFDGQGHANLGFSPDWEDLEKFTTEALRIVHKHFKN